MKDTDEIEILMRDLWTKDFVQKIDPTPYKRYKFWDWNKLNFDFISFFVEFFPESFHILLSDNLILSQVKTRAFPYRTDVHRPGKLWFPKPWPIKSSDPCYVAWVLLEHQNISSCQSVQYSYLIRGLWTASTSGILDGVRPHYPFVNPLPFFKSSKGLMAWCVRYWILF